MGCQDSKRSERIYNSIHNGTNTSVSSNIMRNSQTLSNFTFDSSSFLSNFSNNFGEPRHFPKGEKYYSLIKDSNKANLLGNKDNWQSEKVELFFSLKNVINPRNSYSLSVTIINNSRLGIESYLGELDYNTGSKIDFGNSFEIDYFYERRQNLIITPIINGIKMESKYSFLLSSLMDANKTIEKNITNFGIVIIKCVDVGNRRKEIANTFSNFKFNISLNSIMATNIFFVLNHYKDGEIKRPIYKSKEFNINFIKPELIKIESDFLCNNYKDKIYIDIYSCQDYNQNLIAYGSFTLSQLQSNSLKNNLTDIKLINQYGDKIGTARIQYYLKKKVSYLDKLSKNKIQINLEIAIDFTKSNRPPNDPSSNHFINSINLNDYEKAIKSCGEILSPYDADQLFPVYGFGGIPPILNGQPNNEVSHCFNINFEENAEIHGLNKILEKYRESLYRVKLSGNTKFSFVLKKVISNINKDLKYKKNENHYYILLILTDGVVNDMKETIDLIVEASYLPLSIIIVGIGNEDFTFMEQLDGDEIPLTNSKGEQRKRDIVQFLRFNNFKKNNAIDFGTDFAEEVLKEIPTQIEEYYNNVGKLY